MEFLSNLMDSSPEFGYAKAIVHYACGNKEEGSKALVSATRTFVVMIAGIEADKATGTAGGVLATVGTGACYDLAMAALTDGRHVSGLARVRADNSWSIGGIEILGDVFYGMAAGGDAVTEPWKFELKDTEENRAKAARATFAIVGLTLRAAASRNDQRPSTIFGSIHSFLDDKNKATTQLMFDLSNLFDKSCRWQVWRRLRRQ